MRTVLFVLSILYFCSSCSVNRNIQAIKACKESAVLDSLRMVEILPNDYFYPTGDSICSRIIKLGDNIIPCLVERIIDTTSTKVRIADAYNYVVGDVATILLFYKLTKNIDVNKLMFQEFQMELKNYNQDIYMFALVYHSVFFANTPPVNYRNRIRFYQCIKNEIRKKYWRKYQNSQSN